MSEAVVTFEEAKAALKTFREWEGLASDIDGMWFVLKSDRERTRQPNPRCRDGLSES